MSKKKNLKVVVLQVLVGMAVFVMMMFATAVRIGDEHEIAPALMEEYQVDSFEELMSYGH